MNKTHYYFTLLLLTTLISCSSNSNNSFPSSTSNNLQEEEVREPTPEELRAELKAKEELEPNAYISHKNVFLTPQRIKVRNGGLFRDAEYEPDGALIEGIFVNSATLAKFKDIQIKIGYYSVTKSLIKTDSYTVYVFSEPNSSREFSIKIPEIPSAYDTFTFEVIGATAVHE